MKSTLFFLPLCSVAKMLLLVMDGCIRVCKRLMLLLALLMGQYSCALGRLSASSVVVCNATSRLGIRPSAGRARGRWGGRHCTADQYGYAPLGRRLVCIANIWAFKDFGWINLYCEQLLLL